MHFISPAINWSNESSSSSLGVSGFSTSSASDFIIPIIRLSSILWNTLPEEIKAITTTVSFVNKLHKILL